MRKQRITAGLITVLLILTTFAIAACGSDDDNSSDSGTSTTSGGKSAAIVSNPDNGKVSLTIGSKNFTEQKVLGEIYAQGLEAAGYKVKKELNLGDEKIALKALEGGDISAYPEYSGTVLTSFFSVPSDQIPKDSQKAFDLSKQKLTADKITAFGPTPYTNSNEVGTTQATAKKYGLKKISDLDGQSQKLTLYGTPECRQRLDCLLGLQKVYGLQFKKFTPVAIDLRHEVLAKGQADLSIVFTTDPQVKRNNEVLLDDDKNMFPPYNTMFLVRDDVVQKAGPDLPKVVDEINKGLTDPVMSELNARVDLDKKTPEQVGSEYLSESGLVQ
jgi:glycine betaine/choline ABC-type transport system substrate-binding protein